MSELARGFCAFFRCPRGKTTRRERFDTGHGRKNHQELIRDRWCPSARLVSAVKLQEQSCIQQICPGSH